MKRRRYMKTEIEDTIWGTKYAKLTDNSVVYDPHMSLLRAYELAIYIKNHTSGILTEQDKSDFEKLYENDPQT